MLFVLALIPVFALMASLFLYRHNAKREILKLDFVQFIYSMVLYPLIFVWFKAFIYYLLRGQLAVNISAGDIVLIDTVLSVMLLYVYGFVIIHSVTKSFNLKYYRDPLYDIFEHSEWFHLWFSHLAIYSGLLLAFSVASFLNIAIPLDWMANNRGFYPSLGIAFVAGLGGFAGIWLSDPQQGHFLRMIKLLIAFVFSLHIVAFFIWEPDFDLRYGVYWVTFTAFFAMALTSFVVGRSRRTRRLLDRFKHDLWEESKLFLFDQGKK